MSDLRVAATTILLSVSPAGAGVSEVLLVRRQPTMNYSSLWVFPGGARHAADEGEVALACVTPDDCARCVEAWRASYPGSSADDDRTCVSLRIAAVRELFEEAGVLLARHPDGRLCDAAIQSEFLEQRARCIADPHHFFKLLSEHSLRLDLSNLLPWSRWVTPAIVPRRFDTWFFVVVQPPGQTLSVEPGEASEGRWLALRAIDAAGAPHDMDIAPPTRINLLDLQKALERHGSVVAMTDAERTRPVPAIHPRMVVVDGEPWGVFPWDAEYACLVEASGGDQTIVVPPHFVGLPGRLNSVVEARRMGVKLPG